MSTITEILEAVENLDPSAFLTLRSKLDRIEERLWDREVRNVTAKQRKALLTDARIDALVAKRRNKGRAS